MTNTNLAPLHGVVLNKICSDLAAAAGGRLSVDGVHHRLQALWRESGETDEELRALAVATGYLMDATVGATSSGDAVGHPEAG